MDIIVIGGTGFIGKYLVDFLAGSDQVSRVRLLSRRESGEAKSAKVEIVRGNVFDKISLLDLIVEGAIVVNLAYLAEEGQDKNLELICNVIEVCRERKVRKFIHVSTAVVAGRAEASLVVEETVAYPFSEYDKTKLMVEDAIVNNDAAFEKIILRPTAVFGAEGKNLVQLANDLCFGSSIKGYLKSCLYGRRTMNLVSVENVVSALVFLIHTNRYVGKQVFIVSDDGASSNNYIDVERIFMRTLGISDYCVPRVLLSRTFLRFVLMLAGKSNVDANRRYSSEKLEALGWVRSQDFERRIERFAEWYKNRRSV
ncbi:NAD-dependent epimerase/dehydratase family protein [Pseudomonas sp. OTU5201]|uniref:NAD-dependent epimerase/dehydratase family protein n=1 Tax=Pseudomonas sp. OTU5201 TaxID=3043850 RepID=UPI00313E43CF